MPRPRPSRYSKRRGATGKLVDLSDDDLLAAFDVFTMASRSEGTSVSLLEAMSARVCPVVTDVGGNAAVLGNELCHRLVPREDALALARALSDALMHPGARRHDAVRARARVERQFSLGGMVRRYEDLYAGMCRT